MTSRLMLDENVSLVYRDQLLLHDPSIVVAAVGDREVLPKGTPDPLILEWCDREGFILVTNDRRTMPVHLAGHLARGRHRPGLILLDEDLGIGGNVEYLLAIAGASFPDEWRDRVTYLPLG